ncbi:MAG: GNAT family N-acetyltransferase [Candidatus Promineofilum sp.]|nr:GNAT family N-acetyltransferase [Promineifilum sp.]
MIAPNLLRGEKVRLTAVTSADMTAITRWWGDPDFMRLYNTAPAMPRNDDQISRRFDLGRAGDDAFLFAVRLVNDSASEADDDLIGLLELDGVAWAHRTTFVSIGIGDARYRGLGYGREAMQLALAFAFNELNLYRVCLTVFSYNDQAIALYERLGFVREGTYREHLERDGRRHDMYLYGLLRPEWEKAKSSAVS